MGECINVLKINCKVLKLFTINMRGFKNISKLVYVFSWEV
jgi:hypothetical protein